MVCGKMVRKIYLAVDNQKFERLLRLKGNKTWEELLVDTILNRESEENEKRKIDSA